LDLWDQRTYGLDDYHYSISFQRRPGQLYPSTIVTIMPKVSLIHICDASHRMTQFPDGTSLVQALAG